MKKYKTWQEAAHAARRLDIKKSADYPRMYKKDPKLHSSPHKFYHDFPGYKIFLDTEFYSTWQEASKAARGLGIRIESRDGGYRGSYRQDPKLPSAPSEFYPDFPGWRVFLDTEFYATWQEAGKAAKELGIGGAVQYEKEYKKDSRLPAVPRKIYPDFPGWKTFLDTGFYLTWQGASRAARRISITTSTEYKKKYKQDPRLPAYPAGSYHDFPGWRTFLGRA